MTDNPELTDPRPLITGERPWRLGFWLGLLLLVGVLGSVPYLPFQDVPNHTHLLLLDRAMTGQEDSPYYQHPDRSIFCYTLSTWLCRWTALWLSVDVAVRWLFIGAAVGLPLAVMHLARTLGTAPYLAGLLALPLGVSFPMGMGFLPYVIGLPFVFLAAAAAVRACRTPRALVACELAIWILLSYWAHALAFLCAAMLVGGAWLVLGRRRIRLCFFAAAALLPTVLLLAIDLNHGAFGAIDGIEDTVPDKPMYFRPVMLALLHTLTRSYGITGPLLLVCYLPLLYALVAGIAGAVKRWRSDGLRPESMCLLAMATILTVLALVLPERTGLLAYLASRLPVVAVARWAIVAAGVWSVRLANSVSRRPTAAMLGAIAFALLGSLAEIATRAREIEQVVGPSPPRSLAGPFLVVRLNDGGWRYGGCADYDHLLHVWAYTMSTDGVTPYLFAFNRYHAVWYRGSFYRDCLSGPVAKDAIAKARWYGRDGFEEDNVARLKDAVRRHGFEGVVVIGQESILHDTLANWSGARVHRLAPGIAVLEPPATARAPELPGAIAGR